MLYLLFYQLVHLLLSLLLFHYLNQNEDDFIVEESGVTLLVDAMSMQYLSGAVIGYKTSLMGEQFEIKNPNATSSCGCGSSFSA